MWQCSARATTYSSSTHRQFPQVAAALTAARDFSPEVVFLDIGLPGMDGYEVARAMRSDPAYARIEYKVALLIA